MSVGVLNPHEKPNRIAAKTNIQVEVVKAQSIIDTINMPEEIIKMGIRPYLSELLAKNNLTTNEETV